MILDRLREGRNVGANLALELDRSRGYVNNQLSKLASLELVRRVGPSDNGGLYELTERGELAVTYRERYDDDSVEFESLLDEELRTAQNTKTADVAGKAAEAAEE
ncbi:phage repressor protein [Halogeometricum sp. S1BR25-6]|uniref:Phage repressor protein n=1 Tax=Halogeometricum salsisoli TaxID=2950536 RepID=A0ABU2GFB9_9EURY|nr:phage repressor protein [Halogeometricum sp. S1BR25-6]MDS0299166.1 phage repressor protein [Halogeometricum sp. S1BR25-6]